MMMGGRRGVKGRKRKVGMGGNKNNRTFEGRWVKTIVRTGPKRGRPVAPKPPPSHLPQRIWRPNWPGLRRNEDRTRRRQSSASRNHRQTHRVGRDREA